MNPLLTELLIAAVGVLGSLLTNAYFYGRLTQRVSDHAGDIDDLKASDQQLWSQMSVAEQDIARMEGWMNGKAH